MKLINILNNTTSGSDAVKSPCNISLWNNGFQYQTEVT